MKKRLFALFLCIAMLASLVPANIVSAEGTDELSADEQAILMARRQAVYE